jgi:hypothetical protein
MGSVSTRREKSVREEFYFVSLACLVFLASVLILSGLVCYMTTKIIIYYFLVEKAVSSRWVVSVNQTNNTQYIVRGSLKPRHKTKLWLFNCIFMICRSR